MPFRIKTVNCNGGSMMVWGCCTTSEFKTMISGVNQITLNSRPSIQHLKLQQDLKNGVLKKKKQLFIANKKSKQIYENETKHFPNTVLYFFDLIFKKCGYFQSSNVR